MAAGNSGVSTIPSAALWFAGDGGQPLQVVANGAPPTYSEAEAAAISACADLDVRLDLERGRRQSCWGLTSDLTHDSCNAQRALPNLSGNLSGALKPGLSGLRNENRNPVACSVRADALRNQGLR